MFYRQWKSTLPKHIIRVSQGRKWVRSFKKGTEMFVSVSGLISYDWTRPSRLSEWSTARQVTFPVVFNFTLIKFTEHSVDGNMCSRHHHHYHQLLKSCSVWIYFLNERASILFFFNHARWWAFLSLSFAIKIGLIQLIYRTVVRVWNMMYELVVWLNFFHSSLFQIYVKSAFHFQVYAWQIIWNIVSAVTSQTCVFSCMWRWPDICE